VHDVVRWLVALAIAAGGILTAVSATAGKIATASPVSDGAAPQLETHEQRVARSALRHLEQKPRLKRKDCSGFVESVMAEVGVPRRGSVRIFWDRAIEEGRAYRGAAPAPGHLAFFDTSYDANRNGFGDDTLTHVAVVTAIQDDGTVEMVHRPRSGMKRLRMNLTAPATHRSGGQVLNDYLRAPGYGGADSRRLAAQLWYGFAAPPTPFPPGCRCTCDSLALTSKD